MNLAMMSIQKEISGREIELDGLKQARIDQLENLVQTHNHIKNAESELHQLYQQYKSIDAVVNIDTSNRERFSHPDNIKDNGPNKARSVVD